MVIALEKNVYTYILFVFRNVNSMTGKLKLKVKFSEPQPFLAAILYFFTNWKKNILSLQISLIICTTIIFTIIFKYSVYVWVCKTAEKCLKVVPLSYKTKEA